MEAANLLKKQRPDEGKTPAQEPGRLVPLTLEKLTAAAAVPTAPPAKPIEGAPM
jgi:hypothetical protein